VQIQSLGHNLAFSVYMSLLLTSIQNKVLIKPYFKDHHEIQSGGK